MDAAAQVTALNFSLRSKKNEKSILEGATCPRTVCMLSNSQNFNCNSSHNIFLFSHVAARWVGMENQAVFRTWNCISQLELILTEGERGYQINEKGGMVTIHCGYIKADRSALNKTMGYFGGGSPYREGILKKNINSE